MPMVHWETGEIVYRIYYVADVLWVIGNERPESLYTVYVMSQMFYDL